MLKCVLPVATESGPTLKRARIEGADSKVAKNEKINHSPQFFKGVKKDDSEKMEDVWDYDEGDFFVKATGFLSWDVDGVLVNHAESKKNQKSETSGTYVFINKERVIQIAKKAKANNVRNVCTTSRKSTENANSWLSVAKILEQYESKKYELFDGVRYSNGSLKSKTIERYADIEQIDIADGVHVDDSDAQFKDCNDAGIKVFKISKGTDEEFDAIEKYLDDLIARKNKYRQKPQVVPDKKQTQAFVS